MNDSEAPAAPAAAREPRQSRLEGLIDRARLVLAWERLWPALWPPLGVLAVFAALSWLGLWLALAPIGRVLGCVLTGLALLASLVPLARLSRPRRRDALRRLDRDAALAHRPATSLDDALALGTADPGTRALWEAHRRRAEAGLAALKLAAPRPGMARHDRFALRAAVLVTLAASAFVAGPELGPRLLSGFDWQGAEAGGPGARLDGWIDPPLYTRLPPLILDLRSGAGEPARVRVPVRSTLVIRAAGRTGLAIAPDAGLQALAAPAPAKPDLKEARYTVLGNARLDIRAAGSAALLALEAIPDLAPEIHFAGAPQGNVRGSLTIAYRAKDDYGLTSAEGIVERVEATPRRSLVPAPRLALSLPADRDGAEDTKTTADLSAHPWAGARVRLTLVARDEAGQEGRSETVTLTLPQRPFVKPLAKALVEQRRDLIVEPERRPRVEAALEALLVAPERFTPEPGVYLGLRIAGQRLRAAKSDGDLLEVADFLWQMALQIEDGELSDAERDLRAAQEALRQGLERGAGDEELKKLTQDLRRALDRFLNEFAERQGADRDSAQNERGDPQARTITPNDLKNLLDRMEDLARQGATADAQRLLDELRNILENLRTAKPGRQSDPVARELNRSLEDLDAMIREQQTLRDDTFRDGQGREERRAGKNQQRRGEAGRQGQPQRGGQRQQGRPSPGGEEQADGGQGDADQQGAQGLTQRQQALRERLEEIKRRMKGLGAQGEPGLDEAEGAMREAEGQLGQGQSGEAVDAQGRALDAMRRGAQGLAQQMMGDGDGTEQAGDQDGPPGRPGTRAQGGPRDTDPLGRPTRSRDWSDGQVRIPGGNESAVARARRILDELRRRVSEPERPREELDYIERLLKPR